MRASTDRISALRRMPVTDLAALLERVPAIAASLDGRGPLRVDAVDHLIATGTADRTGDRAAPDRSLTHLGILLSSPLGIAAVVRSLTRLELQLLVLAGAHDGAIDRHTAVAEAGDARELDHAAQALAGLLLAHPPFAQADRWLVLRPGVMRHIPFPGTRISAALANLGTHDLDLLIDRLTAGIPDEIPPTPATHEDRRRLVGALLRRRDVAADLREQLDPDARRVLDVLVDHGEQRVADLGLPPFDPWDRRGGPLHALVQRGMAGVDLHAQVAGTWIDLRIGLRGRLFDDWPLHPPAVEGRPLADPGAVTPRTIRRLHTLLDLWAGDPAAGLANGGLGVRPIRAAAKGLGVDDGDVGLLVHLAIDLGVLGETDDGRWAPTAEATRFLADPPARQWAALVAAWRQAETVDERGGLPTRWDGQPAWPVPQPARTAVLDVLATLDPGSGVDEATLTELCAWRHPDALGPEGAGAMVQALRVLDLVPPDGPVGLTTTARALLEGGHTAVEALLGPPADRVIVQADHTVIAPPTLAPALARRLAQIADLESDAGAQIWRITSAKVAQALADGMDRDAIVALLTTASSVPVPGNVLVTVDDVAARHGRLRAGAVGSYLRCEDPVDLVGAVAVRSARLRTLAPTVAVSPLSRDALVTALRARGLLAVAEDEGGAAIPRRRVLGQALEGTGVPDLAVEHRPDALALAHDLLG